MTEKNEENPKRVTDADKSTDDWGLVFQGLVGIAVWMSFGLLLEGLIAFRVPTYLLDSVTRELFRLAHAHGTLLSLVMIAIGLCRRSGFTAPPRIAKLALQVGVILMPVGFLLGAIGHYETDPNPMVLLAPLGGIMVIFGIIACAISVKRN